MKKPLNLFFASLLSTTLLSTSAFAMMQADDDEGNAPPAAAAVRQENEDPIAAAVRQATADLRKQLDESLDDQATLRDTCDKLGKEVNESFSQYSILISSVGPLTCENQDLTEEVTQLRRQKAESQVESDQLKEQITKYVERLEASMEDLRNENARLTALAVAEDKSEALKGFFDEKARVVTQNTRLEEDNAFLRERLGELSDQLAKLTTPSE